MNSHPKHPYLLVALAAVSLLTAGFGVSQLGIAQAQNVPSPTDPAGLRGKEPAPPPLPPGDDGPPAKRPDGPRERPPRPADDTPAPPVNLDAAPAAVRTATDAVAGFSPGQVWVKTAPRGERQVQATILSGGKEVARLEFDPTTGALLPRGLRPPPARPVTVDSEAPAPAPVDPSHAGGAVAPEGLKARLPEIIRGLRVGPGAEVMGREGLWKVPLIFENRIVAELRVSGDGRRVIQDFGAARDAAIFARD